MKADRVNTVVFNLHQIKRWAFFLGHPVETIFLETSGCGQKNCTEVMNNES